MIKTKDNWYADLFDFFSKEHGLTLTQTEVNDIIHVVHESSFSEEEPELP